MFTLGLLIGIYGYGIFVLGLLGILYAPVVWVYTVGFIIASLVYAKKRDGKIWNLREKSHALVSNIKKDKFFAFLFFILIAQMLVNFIGVLGPELGFDATWYHLTLPKIYLLKHMIVHIPGGLLYYSDMPKFLELLYTGGLAFGTSIFPKLIHFLFGILTSIVLYNLSRKYFSQIFSLFVVIIFASNLVVGWESVSAYVDLGRTFFELLSFTAILNYIEHKDKKWFYYSAIFIGFAIATKLLALGSLLLLVILLVFVMTKRRMTRVHILKSLLTYIVLALLLSLPWFAFSLINTGNPIYPFFSHTYPLPFSIQLINPLYFLSSFWNLLLYSADPLSPIYLITLPLVIVYFKKWPKELQIISYFIFGGLLFWYVTPRTGGGRFILPYLPLMSLVSVAAILSLPQKKIKQFLFAVIIFLSLSSIAYRGVANAKFLPVTVGRESRTEFLTKHLNFSFGDFVDSDGYFKTHIKPTDTVLLYGFHNLYYVDFPFVDSSWVHSGSVFTYIAVQNGKLPKRFQNWMLVYTNPVTHVNLYSAGGIPWVY